MNSARAIQNPIVQSIYRRLSTSDSKAILCSNYNNSNCYSSIAFDCDKSLKLVSKNCQRLLTSANSTKFHIENGMASSAKDGPSTSSQKDVKHKPNRLSLEKSPYLLQHMHNPVDWFPWGDEALEKAQRENKVIFLSVGYSTCHWCHVMEKETFENEAVAKIMNEYFVNIKVDREERPDIDKVYMLFIQTMTYHGGWPMSVFLTPDLKPITGGTYFPPDDRGHLIGFKTILYKVMENWKSQKDFVLSTGQKFVSALQKVSDSDLQSGQRIDVPPLKVVQKCFEQFARNYEPEHGGFNDRPKFPQPSNFNFLFHVYAKNSSSEIGRVSLDMCLNTLQKMSNGGIYDHIGDGFSRYSTDIEWHVPHFEKMLYDQGQLVISYCDAYVVKKEKIYSDVLQGILKYVSRDLSHQLGGFYSAEDADSLPQFNSKHKKEGAFYVWEFSEIETHLGKLNHNAVKYSDVFSYHYGVKPNGNVPPHQDPHEELTNKNVLIIRGSIEKTAEKFNLTIEEVITILEKSKQTLFDVRNLRPRPHLDNKIITAWNGLMISGYAKAGYVLKDQTYINRAILAANFIKKYLYNEKEKSLLRSCYVGTEGQIVQTSVPIQGFLDDYAFLIQGLIDLYEASLDADWLVWAEILQETQDQLFWDSDNGGYFQSSSDPTVILRLKEDQDGAEPSGNSVSVKNLLRGAAYLNRNDLKSKAARVLTAFSSRLERIPMALPEMTSALMSYHDCPPQILIAGSLDDERTQTLLDVVRARLLPGRLLAVTGSDGRSGEDGLLYNRLEVLRRMSHVDGKPAAYVCRHYSCTLPVTDPVQLASLLDEHYDLEKDNAGDGTPSTTQ